MKSLLGLAILAGFWITVALCFLLVAATRQWAFLLPIPVYGGWIIWQHWQAVKE